MEVAITLFDVITQAITENPDAQIIVKPHPMTLDDPSVVIALTELDCLILNQSIHLVDTLETIDHVYTITSLGGFEALLRSKKVTVLGQPFYYGWIKKGELEHGCGQEDLLYICYCLYCLYCLYSQSLLT
ncbi:capsular polysaccharide export protein, LipB/KpsS family [Psychrobacter immobilis]|uniref:capsular polysaccharide export protein, LipB/KpsS family n=1 Tax=Psychrobacter immobilis TaxID=498 RepID=UPI00191975A4|nr:hypothetical protein [Psychrobacter immobilis]